MIFIMRSLRNRCVDFNQFFMCVLIGNYRRLNYREILKIKIFLGLYKINLMDFNWYKVLSFSEKFKIYLIYFVQ